MAGKRKNNRIHCLAYRLRRDGVRVDVRIRTVYLPAGDAGRSKTDRKLRRIQREFNFVIQLEI